MSFFVFPQKGGLYAKDKISKHSFHCHDGLLHGLPDDGLYDLTEIRLPALSFFSPGASGNVAGIPDRLLPDFLCHHKYGEETGIPDSSSCGNTADLSRSGDSVFYRLSDCPGHHTVCNSVPQWLNC